MTRSRLPAPAHRGLRSAVITMLGALGAAALLWLGMLLVVSTASAAAPAAPLAVESAR